MKKKKEILNLILILKKYMKLITILEYVYKITCNVLHFFSKDDSFALCITDFPQRKGSIISLYVINHINQRSIINSVITYAEENN